jgi:hypothetical protein
MSDSDCFNCGEPLSDCSCEKTISYSDRAPVCPHCGEIEDEPDSFGYVDGEYECTCPFCGKTYMKEVMVLQTWTGTRIE